MQVKEVISKVYITNDGKEFTDKFDAEKHEAKSQYMKVMDKYKICDNDYFSERLLGFAPQMASTGFAWYKVSSQEELGELLSAFQHAYNNVLMTDSRLYQIPSYPAVIGYNASHNSLKELSAIKQYFDALCNDFDNLFTKLSLQKDA